MEALSPAEKDQLRAEKKRIMKSQMDDYKIVDPTVRVRFTNLEDPSQPGKPSPPLSFVFGRYIFRESRRPEDGPDTALRDGQVYNLPASVVEHLNNIQIPVYQLTSDPITKAPKTIISGHRNRFSCTPVDMTSYKAVDGPPQAQMRRGPVEKKGPGRPKETDKGN
jgi:hypothetical protein